MNKPNAACIVHVHPQYLTALAMLEEPEFALAHHNNLLLNDRLARLSQLDHGFGNFAPARFR
jgi:ribulose-5-phosphate 4-epimerase/fuculose-1-phosphate aldolase